jgi:hypothetical protein
MKLIFIIDWTSWAIGGWIPTKINKFLLNSFKSHVLIVFEMSFLFIKNKIYIKKMFFYKNRNFFFSTLLIITDKYRNIYLLLNYLYKIFF